MGMQRRHFLAALGSAAATWPYAARAQKAPARIGILANGAAASLNSAYQIRTIKRGLEDNGLLEGRDYIFEARFAAGRDERFLQLALELAQAGVTVILANSIPAVRAAQQLAPPVPVVMISIRNPIGTGLVATLARPAGHTTGTAGRAPTSPERCWNSSARYLRIHARLPFYTIPQIQPIQHSCKIFQCTQVRWECR